MGDRGLTFKHLRPHLSTELETRAVITLWSPSNTAPFAWSGSSTQWKEHGTETQRGVSQSFIMDRRCHWFSQRDASYQSKSQLSGKHDCLSRNSECSDISYSHS